MQTIPNLSTWLPLTAHQHIKEPLYSWLATKDSLSARLREYTHHHIRFELIATKESSASESEASLLGIPLKQKIWLRHMRWVFNDTPWILGHTLIPINHHSKQLVKLRHQSIGDLLFTPHNDPRLSIEVTQKNNQWARRSVIEYNSIKVLVIETFLPDFITYITNK